MTSHVVLDSEHHRDLRVRSDSGAALGDGEMSAFVIPVEFRRVQNEFPILFRRDIESGVFSALALFGFEPGENLFLDGSRWDAHYKPFALAMQPFLIGRTSDGDTVSQVHIDLDHPRIDRDGGGIRLFDDMGRPSPYLERIAQMLGEVDEGYRGSAEFFAALERHNLLEPASLDIALADGSKNRLVGYHLISEDRLRSLDADAIGDLQAGDHLLPIYMALASLSNLPRLADRRSRRGGHA